MKSEKNKSLRLTESAVMVSLAFALSMLQIIPMPFGGSVTAMSMLPVAVAAYRYGTPWGLLTGFAFSLLQLIMGMKNLTYATSAAAAIAIILLDYVMAYTVIGLSGVFKGKIKDRGNALATGVFTACLLRYICHVISGCTVWAGVSIPTSGGLIFSLAYNSAYMIPETLITTVGAYFAGKAFTLTEEQIKRVPMERGALINLYTAIPASVGTVFAFVMIFAMIQTEDGFDITAAASAGVVEWVPVITVFAVGILAAAVIRFALKRKTPNQP
ncbi:MAG: energy-coupled thiamine transporter ThiT [Oscillospiraceae bacterium]|nr:energy-coupled thiamine transporter ThiT [Oscillospiraceae bacterium]